MKKVKLDFMVVPEQLKKFAYVPNKVRVKIIDPKACFGVGILGESGKKLVLGGIEFYFEKKLAERLIKKEILKRV